jgi:hypothetical protein
MSETEKRLKSLRRIAAAKDQQRRATEWRIARLAGEERAALAEQAAIVAALNGEQPLHGLFVETMARHLRVLAGRIETIRDAIATETAALRLQTGQMKQAERMLAETARSHARALEAKALAEIVEAAAARRAASLP